MPPKSKPKSIEETYQKLDQREHVLQRPNMYIGETKKHTEELWIFNGERMIKQMVEYSPGFMKIFDEILTNATDHSFRDQTVTTIKVDFDKKTGEITVWNNGTGIPVVEHREHKIYVPELIFGNLLSGSNYDDAQTRTGAGTNGLGSKLVSIFSKRFVVETVDSTNKKRFVQEYTDNMLNRTEPKITSNSGKSYTKITFTPDYKLFGMRGLEKDAILLIQKRVLDCVACTNSNVQIYLNGEKLRGKGLQDYTKYFFEDNKVFMESYVQTINNTEYIWEWAIVPNDGNFEQVSFVNGNATIQGGKHVDYILYQIINKLKKMLEEKKRLKDIKPNLIKDRLFLFLRATVANPSFNSQTKEQLTTQSKDFGCAPIVSDAFVTKLYKSSITDEIVEVYKLKETMELKRQTDGKKKAKVFIPKLEDALWAGTAKSDQCTLILTEGDSAKTFAMWGRGVVGPDKFGVMPLKGKCIWEYTEIPLWNGEIKYAKDIKIDDILIGDDGNPRTVLTLFRDKGKMYEVSQDRGDSYKVNDEHILTLCVPEHKSIYWVPSQNSWRALYWDKENKAIKFKEVLTGIKTKCDECGLMLLQRSLLRHYERKHKNIEIKRLKEKIDMNDPRVIDARKRIEDFLSNIDDNNIIDLSIGEYIKIKKSLRRKLKGIRGECVNWQERDVLLDPYMLGLWLGDGGQDGYQYACDGENDVEIIEYLNKWGSKNDANFKQIQSSKCSYSISSLENFRKKGSAPLKKLLEEYELINNKHIPKEYLINSKEIRLKLLAGLIDTDGSICEDGTIEISQGIVHEQLAKDIVYLSRSLGFYTHVIKRPVKYTYKGEDKYSEAYRIKISGDTDNVPTVLPRKKSRSTNKYNIRNITGRIKIKEIEDDNYIGIGIDGNSRFLINDFTVTHNCLNIRDATVQQLINNEELNNLKQIIGLKEGVEYTNTRDLRYGKILLLTDADCDGSHIKSLLVNWIHAQWPSLTRLNFLQTLRTPIVKAVRGKNVIEFYTEQDYEKWKESTLNTSGYDIKYFKGLGTSKKEDAKDTFSRFEELKVDYYYKDEICDESILLAFEKDKNVNKARTAANKKAKSEKVEDADQLSEEIESTEIVKCSDRRKQWLGKYNRNLYIDAKEKRVSYQDLINKELIHFSIYDNLRSIPSLCDGLKPSQRKILYYTLKKNITRSIKVAQLSGYVSAETSYHHGEASLQGAIVNMAQDFVGTNNINLLYPDGNHGSRLGNGKDAASPRYIFTRLSDITTSIFKPEDSPLLNYLNDDGQPIEPEWFIPIIPMVLINGCEGIGTGYSTYIPPHNPKDIIENLNRVLSDKEPNVMMPWFRGFGGIVESYGDGSYATRGRWERMSDYQLKITELPIGVGVTAYKEFLESFIESSSSSAQSKKATGSSTTQAKKQQPKFILKDVQNKTLDENSEICFIVEFKNFEDLDSLIDTGKLERELKLIRTFSTNNMYLFDTDLVPVKYMSTTDILLDFYDIRLEFYEKRREYIIKKLREELEILQARVRFINEYITGSLVINKRSKDQIIADLENRKYPKVEESFDYLIRMPIISLTAEKITELNRTTENKQTELNTMLSKTEKDLWREDLDKLTKFL